MRLIKGGQALTGRDSVYAALYAQSPSYEQRILRTRGICHVYYGS